MIKFKKLFCIMTLDYELFLKGKSGFVHQSLIKPTEDLLNLFTSNEISATVFVDSLFLYKLREIAKYDNLAYNDIQVVERQLRNSFKNGHMLGLHIHTSWLNARYLPKERQWDLNLDCYRLHDVMESNCGMSIKKVIDIACNEVNLLRDKDADVGVFRAGGLCIQPFSNISNFLFLNGYIMDSSVAPWTYNNSYPYKYDFRVVPQESGWKFNLDPCCNDPFGNFIEFPIATGRSTPLFRIFDKIRKLTFDIHHSDNRISPMHIRSGFTTKRFRSLFGVRWLTPESLTENETRQIVKSWVSSRKALENGNIFIVPIIHPKVTDYRSLKRISNFIDYMKSKYKATFINFRQAKELVG